MEKKNVNLYAGVNTNTEGDGTDHKTCAGPQNPVGRLVWGGVGG